MMTGDLGPLSLNMNLLDVVWWCNWNILKCYFCYK